ncbi:MAG: HD domain-containing protein [Gammaproteobacteria bacterium]|nr:HD domain-containing protein [Gammaproteobacteria bacterium]
MDVLTGLNEMNIYKKYPVQAGIGMLILFFTASFILISSYIGQERQRDLNSWQSKLSIMADINETVLEEYLMTQSEKIKKITENSSLKLFLTENYLNKDKKDEVFRAQYAHIRNLMHLVARDYGFSGEDNNSANTENDEKINKGLALIDSEGKKLMATKGFLKDDVHYQKTLNNVLSGSDVQIIDFIKLPDGQALFGYVAPVYKIHGAELKKPVGALIILFDAKDTIYKAIESFHVDYQSDETVLLSQGENSVIYLSPLKEGYGLFHQRSFDSDDLASVFTVNNPGGFAIKKDYRGMDVLVLGRRIRGTDWFLMQKIDADEALKESDAHQQFLIITMTLALMLISVMFVAVWRHSTSRRLQKLTNDLESRTALLDAVSDNINEHIFLLDQNENFIFANMSLAKCVNVLPVDIRGKSVASVLGVEVANILKNVSCEGSKSNTAKCMIAIPIGHSENIYHVSTVTLMSGDYKDTRLFVLHDLTALKAEQEKRDRLSRGIISTLVKAVDLHDPFCVDHSTRTRDVAMSIAGEMRLAENSCDALEMASLLANIGKLFVPKEILTKMERLSEEEDAQLKKNIDYAVDILRKLEFDGPVVKIISQKNECLDGSGYPEGLTGDDILIESRILSVANAFVAMASSRAYRKGRQINEVVDILLEQADSHYDRKVIAALFHIAENKTDWKKWKDVSN